MTQQAWAQPGHGALGAAAGTGPLTVAWTAQQVWGWAGPPASTWAAAGGKMASKGLRTGAGYLSTACTGFLTGRQMTPCQAVWTWTRPLTPARAASRTAEMTSTPVGQNMPSAQLCRPCSTGEQVRTKTP